jgi:hypothetical protein
MTIVALSLEQSPSKGQTERRGAVLRLPGPRGPSVESAFMAASMENTP